MPEVNTTYWVGVLFAVVVLVSVFLKMRNAGMKERYGTTWIVIAVAVVVFSVFPKALTAVAIFAGVQVPLNLALVGAAVTLLLLTLRFSVDLSNAQEDRRRLTEEVAILELKVRNLAEDVERLSRRGAEDAAGGAVKDIDA